MAPQPRPRKPAAPPHTPRAPATKPRATAAKPGVTAAKPRATATATPDPAAPTARPAASPDGRVVVGADRRTVWVFEDQLTPELPSLKAAPADAPVFMVESDRQFRAWPFHKHRIAFLVSAMRHFAEELRVAGRRVAYYGFSPAGYRDALSAVRHHVQTTGSREFLVTEPSEHHTRAWLDTLPERLGITLRYVPNTLFLTDRDGFADWARSVKAPILETFYRRMRVEHRVLMQSDGRTPVGGTWNFDKENRKPAPRNLLVPPVPEFPPDAITREVLAEVQRRFPDHPGSVDGFSLPVTRRDAAAALDCFIRQRLPLFGDYEDAMVTGQPVLFHSFLSPMLNVGLLAPRQCIDAAVAAYDRGHAPLNAVEGFVRQILGWREYVYGIYWTFMPEYRQRNARGNTRPLPDFFWDARTDMNCLRQTLGGLLERAYTHHIQRLMVLCNFATLAGLSPQAVNDWFYAMYADAHDWVVTPNVIGMGLCADGTDDAPHRGTMATKPYISSAAYIDRMSDYCGGCRYDPKQRTGPDACPFNYLFWTFLHQYRALYAANPRMVMMLKNLDRIPEGEMREMLRCREQFLQGLPAGGYADLDARVGRSDAPTSRAARPR
ncbi:MAG: cryptochrome/photolyase family protein [Tepidisphaerales bacterium]